MRSCRCERGAALTELAVIAGVLLLAVSGIVDLGRAIRDANVLLQATRHGARNGAAAARREESRWCSGGAVQVRRPCAAQPEDGGEGDAIEAALRSTCEYIRQAGLAPEEWSAEAQAPVDAMEEGIAFRGIRVAVSEVPGARASCLVCFRNLLSDLRLTTESRFALHVRCEP